MKQEMNELFRAIHEGLWASIEYRNQNNEITKYWIGIKDIDPLNKRMTVDGFHVREHTIMELHIYIDRIESAHVLEGTYYAIQEALIEDITLHPRKYGSLFYSPVQLKILNYYEECWKLDSTPYRTNFTLVDHLDDTSFSADQIILSEAQFTEILSIIQKKDQSKKNKTQMLKTAELGLNEISLNTKKGLYVLAYQPLRLDLLHHTLHREKQIVICKEFTIDGTRESIRKYLDGEELSLLDHVEENMEKIRDAIMNNQPGAAIDDMPYIIEIMRDSFLDLSTEYQGILKMYAGESEPLPSLQAFFGNLTEHSRRRKAYPLALINDKVDLDQLLAINHALRYPVSYVQGPPGTGKTSTIVNTIISAFFNGKTVLFTSYNNHPIDEVYAKLQSLNYLGNDIPLPVLRLGSNEDTLKALERITQLLIIANHHSIYKNSVKKDHELRESRAKSLSQYLERYEDHLKLLERKDAAEELRRNATQMNFELSLETQELPTIDNKLKELGDFNVDEALKLIDHDENGLMNHLYNASILFLSRIQEPRYEELRNILAEENENDRLKDFNHYLSDDTNMRNFLRIFPIICTTCISSHKLGAAKPIFQLTIMDESSQCNTAVSLVPIIRGYNMMLVGDPQQLKPVILLSESDNNRLREKYGISDEYDYRNHSVYQTFLACDPVSDEVLLSHHYRCDPKIIGFSNKKYYNHKLKMNGKAGREPLLFVDVQDDLSDRKNTAPRESEEIARFVQNHPNESIGIITPFVYQKDEIQSQLSQNGHNGIPCGTVHAFQGDEKDTILFSLALTDQTGEATYEWLKNNQELINVATSRARKKFIIYASSKNLERLHNSANDDLYELVQYVIHNGDSEVTPKPSKSRALGIRPYSTETEAAFLTNLSHALDNAFRGSGRYVVHKEVAISHVFESEEEDPDFFYKGRFDFVVYHHSGKDDTPVLAIELDGMEHLSEPIVKERDRLKEEICKKHHFELIRVANTYARRYHYIKQILLNYFKSA